MDEWLQEHLVCPRDHNPLQLKGNELTCPLGHGYPCIDDIPIMLLREVESTHGSWNTTFKQVDEVISGNSPNPIDSEPTDDGLIDPYVQQVVSGTCGTMYRSLTNQLTRYPIPSLRLPRASMPEQRFLDIGCNWGRWCISAAKKGYHPVGIDPSLDAIRAARRVARQQGASATYLVADARYLPFSAGSFDVVFSYSVLQHFAKEDVRLVLAECARILKASGTCLIQMVNMLGLRSLWNQMKKGFRKPTHFDVRYWYPSELKTTFTDYIGPTSLFVDAYVGPGVQASDKDMLPQRYQVVVLCSEILRKMSRAMPWMKYWADSLYVQSVRRA